MRRGVTILLIGLALAIGNNSRAFADQEPYYEGKTIKIIVGFTSGGFYDRWSRLLAR